MAYMKNRGQEAYQTDPYNGFPSLSGSWNRQWNVQLPPYRKPLDFKFSRWFVGSYSTTNPYGFVFYPQEGDCFMDLPQAVGMAQNQCYDKFLKSIGDPSQWANNLLEAHESISMIAKRGLQLARFASQLRKGHFGDALATLGTPDKKVERRLRKIKSFGNQFLEVHFGWQPAVEDIGNSLKVLSKADFGIKKVRVGSSYNDGYTSYTSLAPNRWETQRQRSIFSCRMGASVRISNANAYLANQFGVANPLSIAWEAVPYSFVVDWFANVGQCLSAMTDLNGLSIEDSYTTSSQQGSHTRSGAFPGSELDPPHRPLYVSYSGTTQGINITRAGGLAGPTLILKPFKGFSLVRGVTAISLLLQKL